jgi:hypothetical protein
MCNFIFRNRDTGETRRAASFSLNSAARLAGLDVPHRGALPEPWQPWECWDAPTVCLWHYTEAGDCISGPRSADRRET